jgi:hypothetical protein
MSRPFRLITGTFLALSALNGVEAYFDHREAQQAATIEIAEDATRERNIELALMGSKLGVVAIYLSVGKILDRDRKAKQDTLYIETTSSATSQYSGPPWL